MFDCNVQEIAPLIIFIFHISRPRRKPDPDCRPDTASDCKDTPRAVKGCIRIRVLLSVDLSFHLRLTVRESQTKKSVRYIRRIFGEYKQLYQGRISAYVLTHTYLIEIENLEIDGIIPSYTRYRPHEHMVILYGQGKGALKLNSLVKRRN